MKFIRPLFLLLIITTSSFAQTFKEDTKAYQEKYKQDFLTDDHSPIKNADDLQFISFFEPDETYRFTAAFHRIEHTVPFDMATLNGGTKQFVKFGSVIFTYQNNQYKLAVYQNLALKDKPEYKDLLFLPFTDQTNGYETYESGRYLDFRISDINNNSEIVVDFNKAYNPYCAFSGGYSCPKPPDENNLVFPVKAGEKKYAKSTH